MTRGNSTGDTVANPSNVIEARSEDWGAAYASDTR